jgi:hypothetical protein
MPGIDFSSLLPPFQPVELPSRGKYYQAIPGLRDGRVYIREYSAQEEALLAHMNRDNVQLVLNEMLNNCMRLDNFTADNLTTEDAFYLLMWLRANSYGPTYDIEVTCPHRDCGHEDTYSINLSELTINYLTDEDAKEPVTVVGPRTQIKFEINCMRRGTEVQAQRRAVQLKQMKGLYKGDIGDLLKRAYSITRVILPDGQETSDRLEIEELILRYLPASDSLVIDQAIESFKHGVDVNVVLNCRNCQREIFTVVPPGPEFFRPARIRMENPGKSTGTNSPAVQVREPRRNVSEDSDPVPAPKIIRTTQGHDKKREPGAGKGDA